MVAFSVCRRDGFGLVPVSDYRQTCIWMNPLRYRVPRTSIPVDKSTKNRLDELKRDDETWDEFLERTALSEKGAGTGLLSGDGSKAIKEKIQQSGESFRDALSR